MLVTIRQEDPWNLFKQIQTAAEVEQKRLKPTPNYDGCSATKADQIAAALNRLRGVIYLQTAPRVGNVVNDGVYRFKGAILLTIESMLSARIEEMQQEILRWNGSHFETKGTAGYEEQPSLKEILNTSRYNLVNFLTGSSWGPLWGKTTSWSNVKTALRLPDA